MGKPIHCIVDCMTCGKRWESINGQAVGKKHAMKYGHKVIGEIAYGFIYDYEGGKNERQKKN